MKILLILLLFIGCSVVEPRGITSDSNEGQDYSVSTLPLLGDELPVTEKDEVVTNYDDLVVLPIPDVEEGQVAEFEHEKQARLFKEFYTKMIGKELNTGTNNYVFVNSETLRSNTYTGHFSNDGQVFYTPTLTKSPDYYFSHIDDHLSSFEKYYFVYTNEVNGVYHYIKLLTLPNNDEVEMRFGAGERKVYKLLTRD